MVRGMSTDTKPRNDAKRRADLNYKLFREVDEVKLARQMVTETGDMSLKMVVLDALRAAYLHGKAGK